VNVTPLAGCTLRNRGTVDWATAGAAASRSRQVERRNSEKWGRTDKKDGLVEGRGRQRRMDERLVSEAFTSYMTYLGEESLTV
jgi:hypothetical protein